MTETNRQSELNKTDDKASADQLPQYGVAVKLGTPEHLRAAVLRYILARGPSWY